MSRSSSWRSSGVSIRGLLLKRAGQPDDLGRESPLAGLQGPPFGIGEAGEVERQQLTQGLLGLIDARLEFTRHGAQGRDGGLAGLRHGAARVAEERLAGGRVAGRAPGGEDGLGFPRTQAVAREGVGQARLLAARKRRHGPGRGRGEAAGIDLRGHVRCEPAAEGQAPVHPAPAAAEQLGDLGRREVIVVGQRADHAGLVHGTQGPPRGIGLQQARLGHDADGVFDHHRHLRGALARPPGEALEAVQYLIGPVAGRGHAQGQRGQGAGRIGPGSPQRCQRGRELRDRERVHAGHGGAGSTGNSW
jgi:hypothetical protein